MPFTAYLPHQLDNYARLAMAGSGIYAADPGTGKTLAAFSIPLLIAESGERRAESLRNPDSLRIPHSAFRIPKIHFYLCSYTALATTGGDEWPCDGKGKWPGLCADARRGIDDPGFFTGIGQERRGIRCIGSPTLCTALMALGDTLDCVVADEAVKAKNLDSYAGQAVARLQVPHRFAMTGTPIKNNLPDIHPLAEWVAGGSANDPSDPSHQPDPTDRPFTVLIIAPEQLHRQFIQHAAMLRQPITVLHTAADALNDPILTARMHRPSSFVIRHSSLPSAARFSQLHLATETNHTAARREAAKGRSRKFRTVTHHVTHHHLLHRTLAPFILRQRKTDLGIPLIKNMKHTIQVPFAAAQYTAYKDALHPASRITKHASRVGHVTLLRQLAIMAPGQPACPKMLAIVELIISKMWDGKQGLVLSPFREFSRSLSALLATFDVPSIVLDGDTPPAKRGELAEHFKAGHYPVLIGGIGSMGTGSSFPNAQYLASPGQKWEHDENEQMHQRHERIDSPANVDTYTYITTGSVDERIAHRLDSRATNAHAALDCGLLAEGTPEVEQSPADLIREAAAILGSDSSRLQHETEIATRLHDHCGPRLRAAWQRYREHHPAIIPAKDGTVTTKRQVRQASAALRKRPVEVEKNSAAARVDSALLRLRKSFLKSQGKK